jgi:thiol:disulfide interchange protein
MLVASAFRRNVRMLVASAFRRNLAVLLLLVPAAAAALPSAKATGGKQDPVHWSAAVAARRVTAGATFDVTLTAVIEDEWHLYSVTQGPGGPIPTTVTVAGQTFSRAGAIRGPRATTAYDPNFEIQTETYDGTVTLVVPVRLAPDAAGTSAMLRLRVGYQACTNRLCLPPSTITLTVPVSWAARVSSDQLPASGSQLPASGSQLSASGSQLSASGSQLPASGSQLSASGSQLPASGFQLSASGSQLPASGSQLPASGSQLSASGSQLPASGSQLSASGSQLPASGSQLPASSSQPAASSSQPRSGQSAASLPETVLRPPPSDLRTPRTFGATADSWGAFIWLAVTMGALSLLTPCVFPMVPITVSYFTSNAAGTRRGALASAAVYGLGIVLTFTVLGSALAALAGAAGLNRFAANPWVNLGIAAMFVLFALNLFGVYDVWLPARIVTRLDAASRRRSASTTGTLLMAATFTVTSLTCTAAFLGTLLVVASQGEWQRPIAGLLAYSATFALPFVVLAAAPQLVSQLPRSGPWLARVKVVMGFLEIAAAMKFLSNADLVWAWGVFTRNVVLVAWIVTLLALAAYLAWSGRRVRPEQSRGAARFGWLMAAAATLLFAAWLGTGVAGRRLGELEAFLPPLDVARGRPLDFARGRPANGSTSELPWITNDLDAALAEARASQRLVVIDFTGYTCTNCRWMEANMFTRPEIRAALDGFVRARLYTDGQGDVYERQQRLQQEQFRTVALPLYAIVDADRRPVATFAGLTRDPAEFLTFLRTR